MSSYPLFATSHRATLQSRWTIELPSEWAVHFADNPPAILTARRGRSAWNLYRSIESSSFHYREAQHPKACIDVDAAGRFTIPREPRFAEIAPGETLLMVGCGMWLAIYPAQAQYHR